MSFNEPRTKYVCTCFRAFQAGGPKASGCNLKVVGLESSHLSSKVLRVAWEKQTPHTPLAAGVD